MQLRRTMTLNRELQVLRRHTAAIIRHINAVNTTATQRYDDTPRPCVQCIFNKFFESCGGAFNHLTRSNQVNNVT
ncbi:hypothetical protein AA106556_1845 [Neokomagataea tanensis NBRC 106556]|uniref:Transposase n=1 Tax=Neokomagataea tanensis NBRC 106556 TaxID=1223519 RepID=A0ABQ0QL11_9PROT|nr:hypothetical protein AA106556_1845 [Neokomagataea tanensis NBRC 106556]